MYKSEVKTNIAKTPEDFEKISKLRYQVYIEEQGKTYEEANHTNKSFSDRLDENAILVMVEKQAHLEGTVRLNCLSHSKAFSHYADMFEYQKFSDYSLNAIGVCSRLAVTTNSRDGLVREALFNAIYEIGYTRGIRLCFVACAPVLLRLFRAYGFREFTTPYDDAVVGQLRRLVLVVDDLTHLKKVNSPFYYIAKNLGVVEEFRPFAAQLFSDFRSSQHVNACQD